MEAIKVLLIEDDEDQALLISEYLAESSDSFEIDVASNWGECEGRDLSKYDIVLLDYNLPDISGLDALKGILSRADLPVIIVTGEKGIDTVVRALRSGAFDYVVKAGDYLRALPVTIMKTVEQFRIRKEKERLLEELKAVQEKLIQSEKLSAIGRLVAGVAHEINNPLTGIIGYSQMLLSMGNLNPMVEKGLKIIKEEADRAVKIIQNLLQFARKHPPQREFASINLLIQKTLELKEYEFRVNNIEVILDLDPDLPLTVVDPHQLQQVFINILTNAQQAIMSAGVKEGKIRIKTELINFGEPMIRISIADNGPGIPEEILNKIFDPFFTTKEVGQGTGLGLSICYGIVKEHNGNIYALNSSKGGAVIVIELPVMVREEVEKEISQETPGPLPTLKVLVIDDEKSIQDLLVDVLSADGHKVDTASDGRIALHKLSSRKYDVIIADVKMPSMDGKTFFEYLSRTNPSLRKRVIFITGDTLSKGTKEFLNQVDNICLEKPFSLDEIKSALSKVIERLSKERGEL